MNASAEAAGTAPRFDEPFRERLRGLLAWRRDVRRFRAEPLEPGTLARLVAAAASAPSVGFSQPARFVAVDDPERRAAVVRIYEAANAAAAVAYDDDGTRAAYGRLKLAGLREAPAHLAVFCDEATRTGRGLGRATMPETLVWSAVLAVHTLWLVARAEGIGVGWVSIVDPAEIAAVLDVPPRWRFVAYLCVGRPAEEHDDRELARAGWEGVDPEAVRLHRR